MFMQRTQKPQDTRKHVIHKNIGREKLLTENTKMWLMSEQQTNIDSEITK